MRAILLYATGFLIGFQALPGEPSSQLIVQWDNDLFSGSDRGYTNGARVGLLREYDPGAKVRGQLRRNLRALSETIGDSFAGSLVDEELADDRFAYGLGLTQLMFTPEDPKSSAAGEGQRPYAGWLGLEFSAHVKNADAVSSVTLSFGTTGKASFAEDTQTWVHEHISGSPVFLGWDSQVPAELTVNLNFDQKRRIELVADDADTWGIDGFFEWGAAAGNFRTNAYAGTLLRAGWNLPATFSTPRLQLGSYGHDFFESSIDQEPAWSALSFVGLRGTVVLHDITLDGPVFRDFDTGTRSEALVGELLWGFGFGYGPTSLTVSQTFRSDEFEGQNEAQRFGSILFRIGTKF